MVARIEDLRVQPTAGKSVRLGPFVTNGKKFRSRGEGGSGMQHKRPYDVCGAHSACTCIYRLDHEVDGSTGQHKYGKSLILIG